MHYREKPERQRKIAFTIYFLTVVFLHWYQPVRSYEQE